MTKLDTSDLPVLIFAPFGKDASLIERVLHQSAVTTCVLRTVQELQAAISEDAGAAIITEEVLQNNGTIATLAQRLSDQAPWSDFPDPRTDR